MDAGGQGKLEADGVSALASNLARPISDRDPTRDGV